MSNNGGGGGKRPDLEVYKPGRRGSGGGGKSGKRAQQESAKDPQHSASAGDAASAISRKKSQEFYKPPKSRSGNNNNYEKTEVEAPLPRQRHPSTIVDSETGEKISRNRHHSAEEKAASSSGQHQQAQPASSSSSTKGVSSQSEHHPRAHSSRGGGGGRGNRGVNRSATVAGSSTSSGRRTGGDYKDDYYYEDWPSGGKQRGRGGGRGYYGGGGRGSHYHHHGGYYEEEYYEDYYYYDEGYRGGGGRYDNNGGRKRSDAGSETSKKKPANEQKSSKNSNQGEAVKAPSNGNNKASQNRSKSATDAVAVQQKSTNKKESPKINKQQKPKVPESKSSESISSTASAGKGRASKPPQTISTVAITIPPEPDASQKAKARDDFDWADLTPSSGSASPDVPRAPPMASSKDASDAHTGPTRGILKLPKNVNISDTLVTPDELKRPVAQPPPSYHDMPSLSRSSSNDYYHGHGGGRGVQGYKEKLLIPARARPPPPVNPTGPGSGFQPHHAVRPSYHQQPPQQQQHALQPLPPPPFRMSNLDQFISTATNLSPPMEKLFNSVRLMHDYMMKQLLESGLAADSILSCQREMQNTITPNLYANIQDAAEFGIADLLWTSVFYDVYQCYKVNVVEMKDVSKKADMETFLHRGRQFYMRLSDEFAGKCARQLKKTRDLKRDTNMILIKLYVAVGDIERYIQQLKDSPDYVMAREYYLKARSVAPRLALPYNQLGVLAFLTRRKLETAYYYIRTLCATKPILSVREQLVALFNDCKQIYEKNQFRCRARQSFARTAERRCEIWQLGGGQTVTVSGRSEVKEETYEAEVSHLSTSLLMERFVNTFLFCHGMLFSKIGLETFLEVASHCQHEFKQLLSHNPFPLSSTRLLHLTCIAIFSVWNAARKSSSSSVPHQGRGGGESPLVQLYAVQFLLDMFGILCGAAAATCDRSVRRVLLQPIRFFTNWFVIRTDDLWNPPPCVGEPALGPNIDAWSEFSHLANIIGNSDDQIELFNGSDRPNHVRVYLEEDKIALGFMPIFHFGLSNAELRYDASRTAEEAAYAARCGEITAFAEYLVGVDVITIGDNNLYSSVVSTVTHSEKMPRQHSPAAQDDDGEEESINWSREDELRSLHDSKLHIYIEPKFILIDTCSYVDHIHQIIPFFEANCKYMLIVPLVVTMELQSHISNSDGVLYESSKRAFNYIDSNKANKSRFRLISSKGESVSMIACEAPRAKVNDDAIIESCTSFINESPQDMMPKGPNIPSTLNRNIVLITEDNNLRLKAYLKNIPSVNFLKFSSWHQHSAR